jgi:hypothetical protein
MQVIRAAVSAPILGGGSTERGGPARILHMRHRAVSYESGIQLVREAIAAEFDIKFPQHFGLGKSE